MATEGLRLHNLGGKRQSVENHQLLVQSDASSGSDVQEFPLPPKRPLQPRFKARRRHESSGGAKALKSADIHGCCLVLFILLFVATVFATGWLCYITVQLQGEVTLLKARGTDASNNISLLQLASNDTSGYIRSAIGKLYVNSTKHSSRMKKMERRQLSFLRKVGILNNVSRQLAGLQAQIKQISSSTESALQGLATVNNEIRVLQSDISAIKTTLGPSPDLKDIAPGGEPGLRQSVHYLVANHSWVVAQIARAQTSLHASREAFDQKDVDLVGIRQRVTSLEGATQSLTGSVKKHHYNITRLKISIASLDRLTHLASLAASDNVTVATLPASMREVGLNVNQTVLDAVLSLSGKFARHHGNLSRGQLSMEKISADMSNMSQALAALQSLVSQYGDERVDSGKSSAAHEAPATAANTSPPPSPSTPSSSSSSAAAAAAASSPACGCTLEGLVLAANYSALLQQLTPVVAPLFADPQLSGVLPEMMSLLSHIASHRQPSDLSGLVENYSHLMDRVASKLAAYSRPSVAVAVPTTARPAGVIGEAAAEASPVPSTPSAVPGTVAATEEAVDSPVAKYTTVPVKATAGKTAAASLRPSAEAPGSSATLPTTTTVEETAEAVGTGEGGDEAAKATPSATPTTASTADSKPSTTVAAAPGAATNSTPSTASRPAITTSPGEAAAATNASAPTSAPATEASQPQLPNSTLTAAANTTSSTTAAANSTAVPAVDAQAAELSEDMLTSLLEDTAAEQAETEAVTADDVAAPAVPDSETASSPSATSKRSAKLTRRHADAGDPLRRHQRPAALHSRGLGA